MSPHQLLLITTLLVAWPLAPLLGAESSTGLAVYSPVAAQTATPDRIVSRDEATGEQGYKRVVRLFRGQTDQVVYLKIAKAPSTQRGRSESHRVGEASGGGEESDEPPLPDDDIQTIRCTTEHPFWVVGQGFVAAKDLRVGQRGLDSEGNEVVYVSVEIRQVTFPHFSGHPGYAAFPRELEIVFSAASASKRAGLT